MSRPFDNGGVDDLDFADAQVLKASPVIWEVLDLAVKVYFHQKIQEEVKGNTRQLRCRDRRGSRDTVV